MKFKKVIISIFAVLCFTVTTSFYGCTQDQKSIVSIQKTETKGLTDTYTITYTDGSTYNFEITNGKDGAVDVEEVYDAYLLRYPDATFEDFLIAVVKVEVSDNLTVISKALSSTLKVYGEFTESYYYGWPYQQIVKETAIYCGSGVIYSVSDDYTYMITNYHVLYDSKAYGDDKLADKIVCYLYGSESLPEKTDDKTSDGRTIYDYGPYAVECEYIGGSVSADLAVIRAKTSDVKKINENVSPIVFADGYNVGETAIAIGNSENEGISVTEGIVSVDNEYISYAIDGTARTYRSMRIDTAIYGGNSGGGLFDGDGKLIGITNAGDGTDQNINYAIPVDIVKPVVENILHYKDGFVYAADLRLSVNAKNSRYVYDPQAGYGRIMEEVVCENIENGGIADNLGLETNDILLSVTVNGTEHPMDRYFDLSDLLYTLHEGDSISFTYSRNSKTANTEAYTVTANDIKKVA